MKLDNMSEWYNYIMNKDYRQRVDKENGLYLGTFHGAKGLEWKKVIIISANEQITPYAYMGKVDDYEEERRLFYVAMTRARMNWIYYMLMEVAAGISGQGFWMNLWHIMIPGSKGLNPHELAHRWVKDLGTAPI